MIFKYAYLCPMSSEKKNPRHSVFVILYLIVKPITFQTDVTDGCNLIKIRCSESATASQTSNNIIFGVM